MLVLFSPSPPLPSTERHLVSLQQFATHVSKNRWLHSVFFLSWRSFERAVQNDCLTPFMSWRSFERAEEKIEPTLGKKWMLDEWGEGSFIRTCYSMKALVVFHSREDHSRQLIFHLLVKSFERKLRKNWMLWEWKALIRNDVDDLNPTTKKLVHPFFSFNFSCLQVKKELSCKFKS